jgi:hypothetical protein
MITKLVGRIGILIAFMLVVSACGTDNPPSGSDWCYRFWFKESQYSVAITDGFWFAGTGFQPDETGHLRVTYSQTLIVVPDVVILTIARGEGVEGDIDVASAGEIFGIDATQSGTVPADQDNFNLRLLPENAGDGSSFFNISAVAEDTLNVEALTIAGQGESPFPTDNCNGTPTPVPTDPLPTSTGTLATPTPTNTLTPSPTLTPSETLTPSITPTPNCLYWTYLFDFSEDDGSPFVSAINGNTGSYSGGQWINGNVDGPDGGGLFNRQVGLYIEFAVTGTLTKVTLSYDLTKGSYVDPTHEGLIFGIAGGGEIVENDDTSAGTDEEYIFDGYALTVDDLTLQVLSSRTHDEVGEGSAAINRILLEGEGVNPFTEEEDCTTPTPTRTPTHTATPNPLWTHTFTPPPLQTNTPGTGTPTLTRTASPTFIPILTQPPLATFPPPSATTTHVTTATPFGTPAGTPGGTSTPWTPMPITGTPVDDEPWATSVGPGVGPGGGGDTDGDGEGEGCGESGITGLMCGMVASGSNAMSQAFGYIGDMTTRSLAIVDAYQAAPPTAIPGLPHCATDRFGSELCAIYYILTYTLLSGPIGSLIIPVAVIDVDIFIVFTFIKLARAILASLGVILQQ